MQKKRDDKRLEKEVGKWFRYQGRVITKAFTKMRRHFVESAESDFNAMFDSAIKVTVMNGEEIFEAGLVRSVSQGYTSLQDEIGMQAAFELKQPEAVKWARTQAAVDVTRVNDTTRETIRGLVTNGLDKGLSYNTVARQISSRFHQFAVGKPQHHIDSRAHLVAINENAVGYAYGESTLIDEIEGTGIEMEKSWHTVGDDRVSDGCQENADANWIKNDKTFPSGDLMYPRFPGCRCNVQFRVSRDQKKTAKTATANTVVDKATAEKIAADRIAAEKIAKEQVFRSTLKGHEHEIRRMNVEKGYAYDDAGNVVVSRVGEADRITFTSEEMVKIRNDCTVFTHNHPSGGSFSVDDIILAQTSDIREIRAVSGHFNHVMLIDESEFALPRQGIFRGVVANEDKKLWVENMASLRAGKTTLEEIQINHWHEVWQAVAKKYPDELTYMREAVAFVP